MALHAVYTTGTGSDALARCVNLRGDADTTGAICGQIAGAFYGAASFDRAWVANVRRWGKREVELRAALLFDAWRLDQASEQPGAWPPAVGGRAVVRGLEKRPDLNGQAGTALAFVAVTGRYTVRLDGGDLINVLPKNLLRGEGGLEAS